VSVSIPRRRPSPGATALSLAGFVVVVLAIAAIGAVASASAGEQYALFVQPPWAPPAWLFGPVWTVLYLTIAVSGWLVWRRAGLTYPAHLAYAAQLLLNLGWSPLFFGAGLLGVAFAEIVLLWTAIVTTIVLFARISRPAAALLLPYLVWVTFAAALNLAIWQLN
jgi:benzodiazapine receptor